METFRIRLNASSRRDNSLYCEWLPQNMELADTVMHAMTLDIAGGIDATILAYEPEAARAMFAIIEPMFPGAYRLDPAYG